MKRVMSNMLRKERGKPIIPEGCFPYYFLKDYTQQATDSYKEILAYSQQIWEYLGYSGLITPWHDDGSAIYHYQKKSLAKFFQWLEEVDISLKAYCILAFLVSKYERWERPATLLCQRALQSWLKKLRQYSGSREKVDLVAEFMLKFVQLEVLELKRLTPLTGMVGVEASGVGKYLMIYHKVVDRINQSVSLGVDPLVWLEEKFKNCVDFIKDKNIHIKTIVNVNGLDPKFDILLKKASDPWREIKEFLSLPDDCLFPDGYIPKGWCMSGDDFDNSKNIISVSGDGFYYYKDHSQRKGKRHYAGNKYYIIKCFPENFREFKDEWFNNVRVMGMPTWEEYEKYGAFPGMWNEAGIGLRDMLKPVHWRKR